MYLARTAVVVAIACAVRVAAADDLRGDYKVWQDAELRIEPDGATFHVGTIDGPRADHPGATFAVHVIGSHGKLVEVEPACGSLLRGRGLAHVHLFIARADLVKPQKTLPSCRDLVAAVDDSPLAEGRDVIPAGTELTTVSGRSVAISAAPIAVTMIPGAKRVCVDRDIVLDGGTNFGIRVCAAGRAVRRNGATTQHLSTQ